MQKLFIALVIVAVVLLGESHGQDELDGLRKNIPGEPGKDYPIFSTNILCKLNPRQCGGGGGNGGGRKQGGGGGGQKRGGNGGRKQQQGGAHAAAASNSAPRSTKASSDFQAQIAQGKVPGEPGKDYPVNSIDALRKRPGFENIELAPDHLITPDYPRGSIKRGNSNGNKKPPPSPPRGGSSSGGGSGGDSYCPGGTLQDCIKFCPSDESGSEFSTCVTNCGNSCDA